MILVTESVLVRYLGVLYFLKIQFKICVEGDHRSKTAKLVSLSLAIIITVTAHGLSQGCSFELIRLF